MHPASTRALVASSHAAEFLEFPGPLAAAHTSQAQAASTPPKSPNFSGRRRRRGQRSLGPRSDQAAKETSSFSYPFIPNTTLELLLDCAGGRRPAAEPEPLPQGPVPCGIYSFVFIMVVIMFIIMVFVAVICTAGGRRPAADVVLMGLCLLSCLLSVLSCLLSWFLSWRARGRTATGG